MKTHTADVMILGGGIAGLSMARELSLRGKKVQLLERDALASHASMAAAGILVARGVRESGVPGRMFYTKSLAQYPEWVSQLERESGCEVPLHTGDDWCFFPNGDRAVRFRERLERECDPELWEESAQIPAGLTHLVHERDWRIFRFTQERWVRPAQLLPALEMATRRAGAALFANVGEITLQDQQDLWTVRNATETWEAPLLIVAGGPWTGQILSPLGWRANLVPVRGQMALVPRLHALSAMIHLEDTFYLVPRGEYTIVGATVEHGQWSEGVSDNGNPWLLEKFGPLLKNLDLSQAVDRWAGIRPRTRDRVPHIGWLEPGRLLVASGHYRSGISMAPRTGTAVADLLEGHMDPDLASLDPLRRPGGYRRE